MQFSEKIAKCKKFYIFGESGIFFNSDKNLRASFPKCLFLQFIRLWFEKPIEAQIYNSERTLNKLIIFFNI